MVKILKSKKIGLNLINLSENEKKIVILDNIEYQYKISKKWRVKKRSKNAKKWQKRGIFDPP